MSYIEKFEAKKRIIIIGNSPLPFENVTKTYAAGIRTWHFACAARDAHCNVMIIGCKIPHVYKKESLDEKFMSKDEIDYYSVSGKVFEDKKWLNEKITQFKPDCIIGVNTHPSSIVAEQNLDIPFWADLNGSAMAEAQAKAYVYDDDNYITHYFAMESKILSKADVFSAVSESQGFSLLGELAIWGRLSKSTLGYRFVRVIPNTIEFVNTEHNKSVIRGKLAKESDFVILYSGGYNTWTDADTMFHGLEKAMSQNPHIVFVSTGGKIEGHDEITYEHFKELIENSKFKERFHLCGWVEKEELHNYYLESDLGINCDRYCYEALLGSRTRILDWLAIPLPFISTPLSEITSYFVQNGLAIGFTPSNSNELADKLIAISNDKQKLEIIKRDIKKILDEEFSSKFTLLEFKEWLKNPKRAPDHGERINLVENVRFSLLKSLDSKTRKESLAISIWPKISSFLKFLHLSKYESRVKQFGTNLTYKKMPFQYKAKFLNVEIPSLQPNKKHKISIVAQNDGNIDWENEKDSMNPVNFGYRWKDTSGNIMPTEIEGRIALPHSVKPGNKINFEVFVWTLKPGKYILELDFIKEHEFWFSEVNSKPYSIEVNIKN